MRVTFFGAITALHLASGAALAADDPFPADAFADYQSDLANGEIVFNATGCASCHAVEGDLDILAGGMKIETKFGNIFVPNITAHDEAGIGLWSNAEFLNAVMNGVSPDGDSYFGAVFPFASYALMKPEDLLDLKAYLATLPKSDAESKSHEINFVNEAVLDMWSSERETLSGQSDPQIVRGQYLVEAMGHCAECHTPRDTRFGLAYELDNERAFMGETGVMGEYAPDISASRLQRFGAGAFVIGAMGRGEKLNGAPMSSSTMRRIAQTSARLSIEDRAAMYAYLTGAPSMSLHCPTSLSPLRAAPLPQFKTRLRSRLRTQPVRPRSSSASMPIARPQMQRRSRPPQCRRWLRAWIPPLSRLRMKWSKPIAVVAMARVKPTSKVS